jgi:hypothetical protein
MEMTAATAFNPDLHPKPIERRQNLPVRFGLRPQRLAHARKPLHRAAETIQFIAQRPERGQRAGQSDRPFKRIRLTNHMVDAPSGGAEFSIP